MDNVIDMKKAAAAKVAARRVDMQGFFAAVRTYTEGEARFRLPVRETDNVTDPNLKGLPIAHFQENGNELAAAFTQQGTTDIQGLGRFLHGQVRPGFYGGQSAVVDGTAEIEILTPGGWLCCATGEINKELIVYVDGVGQTTQDGI